jgi:hypothetical protein
MIGVKMRDQNRVDCARLDSSCPEVLEHTAGCVDNLTGCPGVDEHQLRPCVYQQCGERYRQHARWQERRGERLVDLGDAGVAHKFIVDRKVPDAVEQRGKLKIAKLQTIDTWSLCSGEGRLGFGRHSKCGGGKSG